MKTPDPASPPAAARTAVQSNAGLDVSRIRAITLDLGDTLWPICWRCAGNSIECFTLLN